MNHIIERKNQIANQIKSQFIQKSNDVIEDNDLEKGIKGDTGLEKKQVTDKNGKITTVYVRTSPTGEKHEFSEGHKVTFEHKGKTMSGVIKKLKHHPITDKFGTAEIHDEKFGQKYSKSLRAIEHHTEGGAANKTAKVETKATAKLTNEDLSKLTPEVQGRGKVLQTLFKKITNNGTDLKQWNELTDKFHHGDKNNMDLSHLASRSNYKSMVVTLAAAAKKVKHEPVEEVETKTETAAIKNEDDGGVKRYEGAEESTKSQKELVSEYSELMKKMKNDYPKMYTRLIADGTHHEKHDAKTLSVLIKQAKHALNNPSVYNK